MKTYQVREKGHFVGRKAEWNRLDALETQKGARFLVVYGRRRVGKTELIEQYFRKFPVWKFEGIEISSEDPRSAKDKQRYQIEQCLRRLSFYLEKPLIAKMQISTWTEFFELIDDIVGRRRLVLYFEEVQWLAQYRADFFSEMKPFWDDRWRHHPKLTLVLCGSSPSFIVQQTLSNRALYGRVQEHLHLQPFTLMETNDYFAGKGKKEVFLALLTVGGVPEYLRHLKGKGTVLSNLCRHSFLPSSVFVFEKEKIFVSSLSQSRHYEAMIEYLSKNKYATVTQIVRALKGSSKSGGSLTTILEDLEACGFIERYTPLHKTNRSRLVRYAIADPYLQWYFGCIEPLLKKIERGVFHSDPFKALNRRSFEIIMGFQFERWCRRHAHLFARILEFSGVEYEAGAFFDQQVSSERPGFQIDLMYLIKGSKVVICEIKYYEGLVGNAVCDEVQQKVELFQKTQPQYHNYSFETVLITPEGVKDKARASLTFDHVITFKEIFDERYW